MSNKIKNTYPNQIPGVREVSPVRIYEEMEIINSNKITKRYAPIARLEVISASFNNIIGNGIRKAEQSAFSMLEEGIRSKEGNVAVVVSRHLSGRINVELNLVADVYNIQPFPYR